METPVRRVTRSQVSSLGPSSAVKAARPGSAMKEAPRRPLIDLTNDSPITGLMPAKMAANAGCVYESTPRSKLRPAEKPIGEDLLRMQVAHLLKKVEDEAALVQKSAPCVPDLFDSPFRLAAPTPANTPVTGTVSGPPTGDPYPADYKTLPPPLLVASPVCGKGVSVAVEDRSTSPFLSTEEILASIETIPIEDISMAGQGALRFDSPRKEISELEEQPCAEQKVPVVETLAEDCSMQGQATTRTLEFYSPMKDISLHAEQPITRILQFDSPEKVVQDVDVATELTSYESSEPAVPMDDNSTNIFLASAAYPTEETEDDDSWSIIVHLNSPEKREIADSSESISAREDADTRVFVDSVLVDPECSSQSRSQVPALWVHREGAGCQSGLEGDDYEDCEDYEYSAAEEEDYEDGSETFANDCEELCRGISHINVRSNAATGLPAFEGKHIRFNYNSDDELAEEVIVDNKKNPNSPAKNKLRGCPTPRGIHIRFNHEDSD